MLLFAPPSQGATDVTTQTISVHTTWDAAGSPYRLLGDVTMTGGKWLTVGPNVAVEIASGHALIADGGFIVIQDSTVTSGALVVTDTSASVVQFKGDVTLRDVAWSATGLGQF